MKQTAKACLTQNTRLIRLAIRVNRTYNRTNRGLIRITLGPFECIHKQANSENLCPPPLLFMRTQGTQYPLTLTVKTPEKCLS